MGFRFDDTCNFVLIQDPTQKKKTRHPQPENVWTDAGQVEKTSSPLRSGTKNAKKKIHVLVSGACVFTDHCTRRMISGAGSTELVTSDLPVTSGFD